MNLSPSGDQFTCSTVPSNPDHVSTFQSAHWKTESEFCPDTSRRSPFGLNWTPATHDKPALRKMSSSRSESQISIFDEFFEDKTSSDDFGSHDNEWTGWFDGEEITWAHPDPGRAEREEGSTVQRIQQSWHPTARISSTKGFQLTTVMPTWRLCFRSGIKLSLPPYHT